MDRKEARVNAIEPDEIGRSMEILETDCDWVVRIITGLPDDKPGKPDNDSAIGFDQLKRPARRNTTIRFGTFFLSGIGASFFLSN